MPLLLGSGCLFYNDACVDYLGIPGTSCEVCFGTVSQNLITYVSKSKSHSTDNEPWLIIGTL